VTPSLVEWIEAGQERAHPDKPAVSGERDAISWTELLRGARSIAARLRAAGIGRGERVGLWMDKTPRSVQVLLGVLHAGAAYVPLDPRSPPARAAAVARDCCLAAVATDASHLAALPLALEGAAPRLVLVDGAGAAAGSARLAGRTAVEPLAAALRLPPAAPDRPRPDDLAYVLYTSGSTGVPKGVAHTHASALAFAQWVVRRFAIHEDDVFSGHAPLHFDLSTSDLFASLGAGASVRLLSPVEGMLAPYLVRMMDVWGITVWYSVPSALVAMLEQGGLEARPPTKLRVVLFAGEVFPLAQLRRLRRTLPDATLANLFGPTETNVCSYHVLPPELPLGDAPLPIGIGCEHLETFAMGDGGEEITTPGPEGTLWARGGSVMRGYWGDAARTAAVLRPDPRGRPGLACCTGDRVVLRADGGYDFRGRRDHQVKVRGHRVELGEIEAALCAHAAVREAVAVAFPDREGGARIRAAAVPRAGMGVAVAELTAHLAARLPRYMLPADLEVVADLPRTSTGKVDRGGLRAAWEGGGHGRGDEAIHAG
jgi:amino acid adenylation domain-containing protein